MKVKSMSVIASSIAVQADKFLGFSDTTINHFMLHKVGLKTFYGQACSGSEYL